jgi:hypothetical protein
MVMAMSEQTVNDQFKMLWANGKIHNVWSSRIVRDGWGDTTACVIDEDCTTNDPKTIRARFDAAFDKAQGNTSMSGFLAYIGPPFISVRYHDYSQVCFNIPFGPDSKLDQTAVGAAGIHSTSLNGLIYVFVVKLVRKRQDEPISDPDAADNVQKYIQETMGAIKETAGGDVHVRAEDFTIESLFLDLENATFTAEATTVYPEGWDKNGRNTSAWNALQIALQSYFTSDAFQEGGNPYVLGYAITAPTLVERAPAVFQPHSVDHSTSFVADATKKPLPGQDTPPGDTRTCAFNYMMMMTPGKGGGTGAMKSVLASVESPGNEQNNALAIDYDLFFTRYLQDVFEMIAVQLNASISDLNAAQRDKSHPYFMMNEKHSQKISATGSFRAVIRYDKMHADFGQATIVAEDSYNLSEMNFGYVTSWKYWYQKTIIAAPTADVEFVDGRLRIELAFGEDAVCNYHTYESNSLPANHSGIGKELQHGTGLHIDLYPGEGGAILASIEPYSRPPEIRDDAEAVLQVNQNIRGSFYNKLKLKDFQDAISSKLQTNMKTLPKVVLPISNVYTYKDIGSEQDAEDPAKRVVTFRSTYVPKKKATLQEERS